MHALACMSHATNNLINVLFLKKNTLVLKRRMNDKAAEILQWIEVGLAAVGLAAAFVLHFS